MISVVLPALVLNDDLYDQAKKAINSIKSENIEIITVNNGSTFGSDFLEKTADIYIRYPDKIGFGRACNAGLKLASGEYLAILSIDTEYKVGGLEDLAKIYSGIDDIGVIFPSGINKGQELDNKIYMDETEGSTFLLSREVYDKVKLSDGLYDERYEHGYWEDRDLWRRMDDLKLELVRTGSVLMNHGEGTTNKFLGVLDKYMEINRRKYIEKWGTEDPWRG